MAFYGWSLIGKKATTVSTPVMEDLQFRIIHVCYFPLQSLLLLHYLVRNGSERVVTNSREHIYDMKPLEEYTFRDEHGKDQGNNGGYGVGGMGWGGVRCGVARVG